MDQIRRLSSSEQLLADRRAHCAIELGMTLQRGPEPADGFVSVRDLRSATARAGTAQPDWRAERSMVRSAGFGPFRASAILGDWDTMVNAAGEASRWYNEPIDVVGVSRWSLRYGLANRPKNHPMAPLLAFSREVISEDIHRERPEAPFYRQLLDGWTLILVEGQHL